MKHLLIVDDDKLVVGIWKGKFVAAGFIVDTAYDAESAKEYLKETKPDIVLLDLYLPREDGVHVLKFIRSNENLRDLPVVVVSSSNFMAGIVQSAWNAGATHFVHKGDFSMPKLIEIVSHTLETDKEIRPVAPANSKSRRILVVDDDPIIHTILELFLTSAKFEVNSALNGKDALEMARKAPPDLMILDILMPVMDGFQVLNEWKHDPILAHIPVIAITMSDDEETKAQLTGDNRTICLTKPVRPNELIGHINLLTLNK